MKGRYIAALAFAVAFGVASAAMGSNVNFAFSGNGITASGTFTVSSTSTPGVDHITDITGTFSDSNAGANVSGAITGLFTPVSYVSDTLATPGVAFTSPGGFSYDDTFYPAGNSPAICYDINPNTHLPELTYPFSGGVLDIFGVAFNIAGPGGYIGALWSNGYLPDSNGTFPGAPGYTPNLVYAAGLGNATGFVDNPNAVPGPGVPPPGRYGTMSTPEPGALVLFGTGLLGMLALGGFEMKRVRSHQA